MKKFSQKKFIKSQNAKKNTHVCVDKALHKSFLTRLPLTRLSSDWLYIRIREALTNR